eukprot:TRINITY_DN57048_c0_g1_i1.p1 TRINITY_DN57048_c0_g1~~TRINITY_DN57048_c0_g1_i1.p1  ORF type:complete len:191 (+),score=10.31 TRINITY_DN57048_c0_g1_i1:92-664(+)
MFHTHLISQCWPTDGAGSTKSPEPSSSEANPAKQPLSSKSNWESSSSGGRLLNGSGTSVDSEHIFDQVLRWHNTPAQHGEGCGGVGRLHVSSSSSADSAHRLDPVLQWHRTPTQNGEGRFRCQALDDEQLQEIERGVEKAERVLRRKRWAGRSTKIQNKLAAFFSDQPCDVTDRGSRSTRSCEQHVRISL